MQISFSLTPTAPLREHARLIKQAENLGFDMAWCPDQGFMRDPFVSLAHTASETQIPLGLAVTNPFARHPLQIARAAGTLADLRENGIVLGLGAGELVRMRRKMGAPEAPLVPTLRETLLVLRKLFAGERVSIEHPAFRLDDVALEFEPTANVALYVASTSVEAFALAGEMADGVIVGDVANPDVMRKIARTVRDAAEKAGRDPRSVKIVAWVSTLVTEEVEQVYDLLRLPVVGRAISNTARKTREWLNAGDEAIGAIKAALTGGDSAISAAVVPDSLIDAMTLVGPSAAIAERIKALSEAGVDMIGCRMPVALTGRFSFESNLQQIGQDIIPAVKR